MTREQVGRTKEHALSFGRAVGDYQKGRPSYPDAAIEWITQQLGGQGDGTLDAVDVGAGTGKFTASLVKHGFSVTAVEPIPEMRAALESGLPTVRALEGKAEAIPLPDGSVDLVTFAQAWHWVDNAAASAEVARVLRPGGALALVWNIRDDEVPWVSQLGDVMGSSAAEQYDSVTPPVSAPLGRVAHADFHWENPMTRDDFFSLVTSRSYVITMEPAARELLLKELDELLDTHPDLAGRTEYSMPYVTRVTIARPTSPRPQK
jgi:SAM-dependent methyltransferase